MSKSVPYSERKFDKKKSQDYNNEYKKNHFDRIGFVMPKGTKDLIKEAAAKEGISAAEWLRRAIDEKLNR